MSHDDGLDRRLTAWLDDEAAPYAPTDLRMRFAEGVGRTRQRPAWATTERWISMETRARLGGVPRLIIILATIGLLAALAAGAYVTGSDGPARNGRIAFVYQNDIYTVEPDGTDRQLLAEGAGTGVAWSPDGTRLAYWSGRDSGAWKLTVVDADGSNPRVVASGDASIGGVVGSWEPAWSPDGSKLAFTARLVGGAPTACVDSSDGSPSFCSSRVFVAEVDDDESTGAVQVGDPDMSARTAVWSPDGTTIAFGSGDAQQGFGLYLMDADGTDVRRLGEVSGTWWSFITLAWSPDGKSIAAPAGTEGMDIWVFPSNGSAETMVSDPPEVPTDQQGPAYAPDGALVWWDGVGTALLEPGGTPRTLAFNPYVWSPDGLYIVTTSESASGDLVIIDRDGTIVTTIVDAVDAAGAAVSWQRLRG
jgi:Tol biopolymer transport system component